MARPGCANIPTAVIAFSGTGRLVDVASGTRLYIDEEKVRYGLGFVGVVDARSDWLGKLNLPDDPYASMRDSYLARREREVADVVETPAQESGGDAGARLGR